MHYPQNDRFGLSNAKIDVVPAVDCEAEAGADIVARNARMPERGYLLQMGIEAQNKAISSRWIVLAEVRAYLCHVTLSGIGDVQDFRCDCPSPNRLTSARN